MHATAATASQSMPASQLSVCTITVVRTSFRVHTTFRTYFYKPRSEDVGFRQSSELVVCRQPSSITRCLHAS